MICDGCHIDRPSAQFRPYAAARGGLHSTCNRCHAAQQRQRRGGLRRLILDMPLDLRAPVQSLLSKTGETPGEMVERLVRRELSPL